jgi:hypothetical protein
LLEDLIGASAAFPISPENPVFHALPEVTQAEQAEGVHFLGPTSLPVGSVFEQAVYDRSLHTLKLTYQPQKGSSSLANVHLTILEIPVAYYQYQLWDGYPPGAIEQVSVDQGSAVGETTGYLITGSVIDGQYQPNHSLSLIWVTQGLVISIQVTNAVDQAMPIDQAEILAIAIAMN